MNEKLQAQLNILKVNNTKPNFSALSREYGVDRRTIKKYYDGYEGKPVTRAHHSKLDQYEDLIRQKLNIKGTKMRAVYEYILANVDPNIGTYSNFRKFIISRGLRPKKKANGNPRFETRPGHQAQVDWKEDISLRNRYGEEFIFQVFSYKLGYSRYDCFVYSSSRTQQDLFDCLITAFQQTGGVPEEILFDNMGSIVSIVRGKRRINNRIKQFADDFGFRIRLAKPRRPETKGKVESANKFVEWVLPYNDEFETESELVEIIRKINERVNTSNCQATNMPPILLFQKEKEYLRPLPSRHVIDSYHEHDRIVRVHKDSLVVFDSARYSVPPAYIGKEVALKRQGNILRIYHDGICIAKHEISNRRINYAEDHYRELLKPLVNTDQIDSIAEENLKLFDTLL
ncbi:MAG: IS21 family transposase [Anaerovoracaceae bacterium]|nr:IS21 family transposase [Bacillota bacterium]MDY2670490.1 IS21 family transposase [Anaerovoracaceae bacterium]